MEMSGNQRSLNPAANTRRMYLALGLLLVLGVSSWFTLDPSAVLHVDGYSGRFLSYSGRDVPIRWFPILILGLFAFRIVIANMRARFEERKLQ